MINIVTRKTVCTHWEFICWMMMMELLGSDEDIKWSQLLRLREWSGNILCVIITNTLSSDPPEQLESICPIMIMQLF